MLVYILELGGIHWAEICTHTAAFKELLRTIGFAIKNLLRTLVLLLVIFGFATSDFWFCYLQFLVTICDFWFSY